MLKGNPVKGFRPAGEVLFKQLLQQAQYLLGMYVTSGVPARRPNSDAKNPQNLPGSEREEILFPTARSNRPDNVHIAASAKEWGCRR